MSLFALLILVGQGVEKPVSPVLIKDGNQFVEVSTLARWVGFVGYQDEKAEKVVFIRDGRILEFVVGSPKMMMNGRVTLLPVAPLKSDGEIFLPLKSVANACGTHENNELAPARRGRMVPLSA
ncbi:MAG: hypothetical protein JWL77_1415 [Chthonomonadaceae bacterium]|nr:hypothetical protein [Chthonomonadaceae bacterium]